MKSRLTLLIILALACFTAIASGAPWYKWKNKLDGSIICAQITPGEAWFRFDGPYMESRCKKAGNPQ